MEICVVAFIGLWCGAFGALFSALPWPALDTGVRKLLPRFNRANSGLEKLRANKTITQSDKELGPLNRLLKTDARELVRMGGTGLLAEPTMGIIAPENQCIRNQNETIVDAIGIAQGELDRRIRDTRMYIGLGIMALGFILQLFGA